MEETKNKKRGKQEVALQEVLADMRANPHPAGEVAQEKYFTAESWKGVKTVFKCAKCETFRDTRDEMIEHVLLHYPKDEQEKIFNQLVKE